MASNPPIEIAQEQLLRIKRVEYDQLAALGVLGDERVELIYGLMVRKSTQDPRHFDAIDRMAEALMSRLAGRARVRVQGPFAASEDSEPEPDVALVPLGDYSREHPQRALLVVEVANTSLTFDRRTKARLYAECGVPEYWIVNVVDRVFEVHTDPAGSRYANVVTVDADGTVTPRDFPDVIVRVADVIR